MTKQVIHISESEAANDFARLLAQVRAGVEVVIEQDDKPIAVVSRVSPQPARLLSESIAIAESRGCTTTLDGGFADDLEQIIGSHREPLSPPTWD